MGSGVMHTIVCIPAPSSIWNQSCERNYHAPARSFNPCCSGSASRTSPRYIGRSDGTDICFHLPADPEVADVRSGSVSRAPCLNLEYRSGFDVIEINRVGRPGGIVKCQFLPHLSPILEKPGITGLATGPAIVELNPEFRGHIPQWYCGRVGCLRRCGLCAHLTGHGVDHCI